VIKTDRSVSSHAHLSCVVLSCNRPNRVRVTNTNLNNDTLSILSSKANVALASGLLLIVPGLPGPTNVEEQDK